MYEQKLDAWVGRREYSSIWMKDLSAEWVNVLEGARHYAQTDC